MSSCPPTGILSVDGLCGSAPGAAVRLQLQATTCSASLLLCCSFSCPVVTLPQQSAENRRQQESEGLSDHQRVCKCTGPRPEPDLPLFTLILQTILWIFNFFTTFKKGITVEMLHLPHLS